MDCTHIILKTNSLEETREYYEKFLGIKNHARIGFALKVGSFVIGFEHVDSEIDITSNSIEHIGILLDSREEVDRIYEKLNKEGRSTSLKIGGPGQGPYRFYTKDPNGYNLEFETWDAASDK